MVSQGNMKVLIVASWYKNQVQKNSGSFFFTQALALSQVGVSVQIISNNIVAFNDIRKYPILSFFSIEVIEEKEIQSFRLNNFELPKRIRYLFPKFTNWINLKIYNFNWNRLFKFAISSGFHPNLIHAQSHYPGSWLSNLGHKFNIPYVLTEHWSGMNDRILLDARLQIIKPAYQGAMELIGVSNDLCKIMEEVSGRSVHFLPNGVFFNTFFNAEVKKFNRFSFIVIGNLLPIKQVNFAIQAFANKFSANLNCQLLIVGSGPEGKKLKEMVKTLKLDPQVFFLGEQSPEEVKSLLAQSHVLLSPAKYETFGMTVVEAHASGIPAVAVNTGGRKDTIFDPVLGILCEDNIDSIADGMSAIFNNYQNYHNPLEIHNLSKNSFDAIEVANNLKKIYRAILSDFKGHS